MSFFNINPMSLPKDAQYYFNILIIIIYVSRETMDICYGKDKELIWFLDEITEPRPTAICICALDEEEQQQINEEYQTEVSYSIEMYPHTVLEVDPNLGIGWYPMRSGFEESDPWSL